MENKGLALPSDRAVVNGAQEVPAVPASVPSAGWHPMDTVPRDGTIFAVRFYAWNVKSNPAQVQMAQWLPFQPEMHGPWDINSHPYGDGWMTLEELNAQAIEARRAETLGSACESAVRQDAPNPTDLEGSR